MRRSVRRSLSTRFLDADPDKTLSAVVVSANDRFSTA
jgi:hypothetical protein